jgi:DNA primase
MSHLNQFVEKCHTTLTSSKSSEVRVAMSYLSSRHITPESINLHKIGYCLSDFDIPNEIKFHGKSDIKSNDKGYSYFILGRIIVPIYSEFSNLVGFATRKPSNDPGNTWWNISSPFKKGNHLFILNKSRREIFKKNKIYLVEGYIDAITLYQEGLREVAALMGTHLTSRKIGLIARYCDNVCLCFDADQNNAGQQGREKAVFALSNLDFVKSISFVDLPLGVDPDSYVVKNGIDGLLSKEKKLTKSEIKTISRKVFAQKIKKKRR